MMSVENLRILALASLIPFLGIACATTPEIPRETPNEKYQRLTEDIRRNQADSFQQHEARGNVSGEESSGMAGGTDLNEGNPSLGDDVARQNSDRPSPGPSQALRDHGTTVHDLTSKEANLPQQDADLRDGTTDPASGPLLVLSAVPNAGHVGDELTLNISISSVERLYAAPFYLIYDPAILELTKVTQGDFLKQDGQQTAFLHADRPDIGRVMIGLSRLGQVTGITGAGTLVSMTFRAKAPGMAAFGIEQVEFRNTAMEIIPIQVASAEMMVE